MSIESFQDSLFEDPIGLRFRHAREKERWTLDLAAQRLKLPVAVLDAIEREDWARLGAPIFVRSYVGSYARLLGLPATLADEVVRGRPAPPLVSIGAAPLARSGLGGAALGYLLMTLLVIAAVVAAALLDQAPGRSAVRAASPAAIAHAPSPAAALAKPVARESAVATDAPAADAPANHGRFTVSSDGGVARN